MNACLHQTSEEGQREGKDKNISENREGVEIEKAKNLPENINI